MKRTLVSALAFIALAGLAAVALPSVIESAPPVARPTPTAMAAPGSGPQASPQELCPTCADLVVTSITTDPPVPTVGVTATVKVVIANVGVGNVPAGRNFYVDLYVRPATAPVPFLPGDVVWGAQSWYVPAGGTYELTTRYRFDDTNTYALYAQIDTDNSVTETNELNNVLGPVAVNVQSSGIFQQATHEAFQYGIASGLDLSHPDGVVTLGFFDEPWQDAGLGPTSVYTPDVMINDVTASYSGSTMLPTTVEQVRPSIVADADDNMYSVWQDARHGGTYNNRIYFARSTDRGLTWSANISVTADIPATTIINQLSPRIAYDNSLDQISVVWQDNRRGHYDIWYSASTDGGETWTPSVRVNDDTVNANAHKQHPSLDVLAGSVYVVWQDQRNGNDDIYMTRSDDGGVTWPFPDSFVTDDPETTLQDQRAPSIGLGCVGYCVDIGDRPDPIIYVAWEDWRDPVRPEVYVADSFDNGWSFGIDVPVAYPAGRSYRVAPTMLAWPTTVYFTVEKTIPGTKLTYLAVETATVDVIHVAWQEGKDEQADIYYTYSWYSWDEESLQNVRCPVWSHRFCFQPTIRVNGQYWDYDFAQPPDGDAWWPIEPTWQGEVAMTKAYRYAYQFDDPTITYSEGVWLAWSDGRGFDRDRRDLFVARIAHPHFPNDDIKQHVLIEGNWVLNDNAKLYKYRDDAAMWAVTKPANVRQSNPSIFAVPIYQEITKAVVALVDIEGTPTLVTTTVTTTMAVDESAFVMAWDDDRWDTPLTAGTRRNRDVFSARRQETNYGVYLSPVFDTGSPLKEWFTLDWYGTTDYGTPIYFQTRTGSTPTPPKENAATGTWSVFTGTQAIQMQSGPTEPIYVNDAPGQPIASPPGRYIQYKLIIDGPRLATAVTRVTIHYETGVVPVMWLPSVYK